MAISDKLKKIVKRENTETANQDGSSIITAKREKGVSVNGSHYGILQCPHITEKSSMVSQFNKYVFKVAKSSNKTEIKKAVESIYGVTVEDVSIANMPGKKVRMGRSNEGRKAGFKKAIVSLKEGDKIDIGV